MRHEMKPGCAFSWRAHHPHSGFVVRGVRKVCCDDCEIPSECVTVRYVISAIKQREASLTNMWI